MKLTIATTFKSWADINRKPLGFSPIYNIVLTKAFCYRLFFKPRDKSRGNYKPQIQSFHPKCNIG